MKDKRKATGNEDDDDHNKKMKKGQPNILQILKDNYIRSFFEDHEVLTFKTSKYLIEH